MYCSSTNAIEERALHIQLNGEQKELNARDRLNTRLRSIGTHHESRSDLIFYTSITTNEECVLRRVIDSMPVEERCENLTRTICQKGKPIYLFCLRSDISLSLFTLLEMVLKHRTVIEDCSKQSEYCHTTFDKREIGVETVVCQSPDDLICSDDNYEGEDEEIEEKRVCEENVVALCRKKPKLVTVTEKRQACGSDSGMKATKICITLESGEWSCQNLTSTHDKLCDETNVTKIISTEVAEGEIECREKKLNLICHSPSCTLATTDQVCVKGFLPMIVELKETVCDQCVHGRNKVRPVLEEAEVCRSKIVTSCANVTSELSHWKKWCRPSGANATPQPMKVDAVPALVKIEVAPGEWKTSSDMDEIRALLSVKQRNENALG